MQGAPASIRAPPARIVVDRHSVLASSYCWRDSWSTGYDSAFSLVCKFAVLNALTAREIANLFVSAGRGRKGAVVRQLQIDLRDPQVFDLVKMARLCRASEQTVADGFVLGRYLTSLSESSDVLRYCPECLTQGFHSPLFQLVFVPRCPVHRVTLTHGCQHCRGVIPYQVTAATLQRPFRCPHCEGDWAPALRTGRVPDLRFDPATRVRWDDAMEIATRKSRFLGGAAQLGSHFPMFGVGRLVISAPRIERSKEQYYAFIDGLVRRLRPELARSFERHNSVMEFERGPSMTARMRIAPWRRPRPRLSGCKTVPQEPRGLREG